MATQLCPKCKEDSFSWYIDDEVSHVTVWNCYNCSYFAYEDESLETVCEKCGIGTKLRLKDELQEYWWCNKCNSIF